MTYIILREQKLKNCAVSQFANCSWKTTKEHRHAGLRLKVFIEVSNCFLVKILSWSPLNTIFVPTTLSKFSHTLEGHVTNAIALTVPRMENQSCVT